MIHAVGTALGEIIRNLRRTVRLTLYENRSRRAGMLLGRWWDLLSPLLQILIYWFVFSVGLGTQEKKRLPVSPVADVRHDAVAGAQLRHSRRVRVHPAGRVHHPQRAHSALHHPDEGGCARVLRAFVDNGDSADCAAPWRRAGDVALSGTGVLPRGFVGAADRRGAADEQPDGGLSRLRRAASAADAPAVLRFQRRVGH